MIIIEQRTTTVHFIIRCANTRAACINEFVSEHIVMNPTSLVADQTQARVKAIAKAREDGWTEINDGESSVAVCPTCSAALMKATQTRDDNTNGD